MLRDGFSGLVPAKLADDGFIGRHLVDSWNHAALRCFIRAAIEPAVRSEARGLVAVLRLRAARGFAPAPVHRAAQNRFGISRRDGSDLRARVAAVADRHGPHGKPAEGAREDGSRGAAAAG